MFIIFTPEFESVELPGVDLPTINSSSTTQSPNTASDDKFTVRFVLINSSPGPSTISFAGLFVSIAALPNVHVFDPLLGFHPVRSRPFKSVKVCKPAAAIAAIANNTTQTRAIGREMGFIP